MPKAKKQKHPDRSLIAACVEYAFTMGAANYAFKVDPTDSDFAGPIDCANVDKARKLVRQICSTEAATADGLAAKARLIIMMDDASLLDNFNDDGLPVLTSLARDVAAFHSNVACPAIPFAKRGAA